jgi:hypothetical protein
MLVGMPSMCRNRCLRCFKIADFARQVSRSFQLPVCREVLTLLIRTLIELIWRVHRKHSSIRSQNAVSTLR